MTGSSSEIVYIPYEEAYTERFEDMRRRVPDISKIAALIGYQPTRGMRDVLRAVIDHLQGRMEEELYGGRWRQKERFGWVSGRSGMPVAGARAGALEG